MTFKVYIGVKVAAFVTVFCNVNIVLSSNAPTTAPRLKIKLVSDVNDAQQLGEDYFEDGIKFKQHGRIITEKEHVNGSQNIHVITLQEDNEISTLIVDGNKDMVVVRNEETCYVTRATATLQLIYKIVDEYPVVLHFVGSQQIPLEYFVLTSDAMISNLCSDLPIWWSTISCEPHST
ncbi:uncharacterized protein LOC117109061 [Anneissia japonica]|uniref:uncharacterized protein LOC117109061 n=1 Tax=Anneissia japonica TaxID=1529436 RepID=UPI00142585A5|nr:uncharacterized protein LOC117109061 [Anneissia japonica]